MKNHTSRIRMIIPILVIVALLVAGTVYLLPKLQPAPATTSPAPVYQTVKVAQGYLTASVTARGAVRANQTAVLPWQTTGTVSKVNFEVGQTVQTGQVLATLDATSLPQNVILARSDLVAAQRALDNLRDSASARAQAQLAVTQAFNALDDAQQHRTNLDYRSTADQVAAANAGYILAQDEVDRLQGYYDTVSSRPEDDPTRALALANLENAKKKRDKAQINLNWYKGKADPKDIAEADAAVAVAQARLEDAQREWERLRNGTDPKDIAAAQARVDAIQATLNLARITAPFDGTLTVVSSKAGDEITPGALAFQLDDLSRLYVDVLVPQAEINRVQPGQTATLSLDAIPGKGLAGQVTEVSWAAKTIAGVVNYGVSIQVTDKSTEIRPGMTLIATIALTQPKQAILIPEGAIRTQAGKPVVYLLKSGSPVPVPISLGIQANHQREVLDGDVHAGDLVILNPSH
ncbi:MAG TPA: efflux RND transporter periplasmic adaptor subunit [Anaerolineaceae bacterium]|nr:efflux RND transporter periplasmic adaptor subunit [Anaerolineaceae bacterium]